MRIWSSREHLPPGCEQKHATLLTPFWGRTDAGSAGWPDYADALIEHGREFLDLTELTGADIAVHPLAGRLLVRLPDMAERARAFADEARAAGRRSVFFIEPADTRGHLDPPFPVRDALVLRGSIFRSRRERGEYALPGWHDDVGAGPVRARHDPVVSFCGAVIPEHPPAAGLAAKAKRAAGDARRLAWRLQRRHEEDLFVRARALAALERQDAVRTSIVVRGSGGGGSWGDFDHAAWSVARGEYLDNMRESDYVLCTRGDGNWSVRYYEAMCMGRIPVVVDTDLVMPYDWLVDWRRYGVWLDRSEVPAIGERVTAFHDSLTDGEFADLQRECRELWERYFSPLGFFRSFHLHLEHAGIG